MIYNYYGFISIIIKIHQYQNSLFAVPYCHRRDRSKYIHLQYGHLNIKNIRIEQYIQIQIQMKEGNMTMRDGPVMVICDVIKQN